MSKFNLQLGRESVIENLPLQTRRFVKIAIVFVNRKLGAEMKLLVSQNRVR